MYKVCAVMEQIPTGGLRDQKAGHWTCCGRAGGLWGGGSGCSIALRMRRFWSRSIILGNMMGEWGDGVGE